MSSKESDAHRTISLETPRTQQPTTAASYDGPVVTPHPPARRHCRCRCRRRRRCRCRRRRRRRYRLRHCRQAGDEFLASQGAFFALKF